MLFNVRITPHLIYTKAGFIADFAMPCIDTYRAKTNLIDAKKCQQLHVRVR